ncbi:DUF4142 domain-containing protein [Microbispora sp. NPDC049125]|uniref:DUF4142 domain-containing protein n=1 Tax=Microbispora sp. NPDC049125 TaxID=3154929 RepID=UPI0034660A9B
MLRRLVVLVATVAATTVGSAVAFAAAPDVNEQDRTFLAQAHQGNLFEIESGRLAERKASDQGVKEAGTTFVRDHTKLDAKGAQVAGQLGVDLPGGVGAEQQATIDEVSGKTGAGFDQAWVAAQIAAHKETLAAGQKEVAEGSSEQVKQLARDAEPVVKQHLDLLQGLQKD